MEFNSIKCPVCGIEFNENDDIVVCPECGAPHHRECYEKENKCFYNDEHKNGFNFDGNTPNNNSKTEAEASVICPRCKGENPKGAFYCSKCGMPLGVNNSQGGARYTAGNVNFQNIFDPMAGVNPEEDMGENVTAGEISKFVQNNTPYFIRVFNNIKTFSKGRFNFCAFLFSGGYLLYRKMYKIGAVITSVMLLLWTAELYIHYCTPAGQKMIELMNNYYESAASSATAMNELYNGILSLDTINQFILGLMYLCAVAQLVIRIIIGIMANRIYFKHCKEKISEIKQNNPNPQAEIQAKGGVNTAIAVSLLIVYFTIEFIPFFITGGTL